MRLIAKKMNEQGPSPQSGTQWGRVRYLSQRLGRADRPMLRAERIRRKLGSEDGLKEPAKPKGMHWSTYNRLLDQADELDDMGWAYVLGGLLRRAG